MPQLIIRDFGAVDVPDGKRLVLALEDSGIDLLHRCGGYAKCTTCRVQFVRGEPERMTQAERARLEERGVLGEVRLSCQILCDHDMTLTVINTVTNSDVDEAGPRPADEITPPAVWLDAPRAVTED